MKYNGTFKVLVLNEKHLVCYRKVSDLQVNKAFQDLRKHNRKFYMSECVVNYDQKRKFGFGYKKVSMVTYEIYYHIGNGQVVLVAGISEHLTKKSVISALGLLKNIVGLFHLSNCVQIECAKMARVGICNDHYKSLVKGGDNADS